MNFDEEILQDFLVEAGELFDQLGEQIVELEQQPEDSELLNSIFRAFHTIKGGAGFLKVTPMVEICHRAEDVFNVLRQKERAVDAELIDVILQVIDVVGEMFDKLRAGEALNNAEPDLLVQLEKLAANKTQTNNIEDDDDEKCEPVIQTPAVVNDEVDETLNTVVTEASMDDEFEAMLQAAQQPDKSAADVKEVAKQTSTDDLISDNEFENLLDQLHGVGKHSGVPVTDKAEAKSPEKDSNLISDDEFEAVLDQMYGKNSGPGSAPVKVPDKEENEPASENKEIPRQAVMPAVEKVKAETNSTAEKLQTKEKQPVSKPKKAQAESSVRVETSRLDNIMNLVGELVLVRNRLSTLKQIVKDSQLVDAISNLELVTSDLQSSVMKTRMQPIKKVFNRFPRVIRDLARQLNKDIDLQLIGEDTDLDKNLVEALVDPLIHLVRNAVDHGIELPEERFASGKPRQGTITLSAAQEGDQILLTISDDGKGMDERVLRQKAIENELMGVDAANNLTEKETYNLIFEPGFSTKTEVSEVSGRGVGMDVVKTRISELNGTLEIDSKLGRGTVITIRLPLTLAILPTLMVNLADYQFALPLSNVVEAFNMDSDLINVIDGQEVVRVRQKPLPLYYLHRWLITGSPFNGSQPSDKVIVIQMGSQKFCLVVDNLIGQEEVVIKPLGSMIAETPGFSGATITGDGSIALVLDMPSLIKQYAYAG